MPGEYSTDSRPPGHRVEKTNIDPDNEGVYYEERLLGSPEHYLVSCDIWDHRDSASFARLVPTGQADREGDRSDTQGVSEAARPAQALRTCSTAARTRTWALPSRRAHGFGPQGPVDRLAADAEEAGDLGGTVLPPSAYSWRAWLTWLAVSLGLRPLVLPRARAAARPSRVPSTMSSRWNSSRAPRKWNTRRPCGVVVSICCLRTTRPTPRPRRSFSERLAGTGG